MHFFPLQRMANSMGESLENDPSSLMELQTQKQKGSLRYKIQCKIVGKSELQSPTKLPLMAIKGLFVGALTASGKLDKPIPGCR